MAAVLVDEAAVNNVAAYIDTFPDTPATTTISGDVAHGKRLYVTCANCHGKDGQGIWAMNAPRLAGMDDAYFATQLQNFKTGVRGEHRQDFYGKQMGFMARTLHDDTAINDVIAYINTLQGADK